MSDNVFYDVYQKKYEGVSWGSKIASGSISMNKSIHDSLEKELNRQLKSLFLYGTASIPVMKGASMRILQKGDRVQVLDGWVGEGDIGFFVGKDPQKEGYAYVEFRCEDCEDECVLDCISMSEKSFAPKPYTFEERIERAVEDYEGIIGFKLGDNTKAAMYAIIEAEVSW